MSSPGRRSRRDVKSTGPRNIFSIDSRSALQEFVQARPERVLQIEVRPEQQQEWRETCENAGLGPEIVKPNRDLSSPVLGLVKLTPVQWRHFSLQPFAEDELILILDHITDPRNLGAIARTAGFYGIRWILAPQRRQVLYTQASVATSMGGFALVDLVVINNVAATMNELREMGFRIFGAHMDGSRLSDVKPEGKSALVLGAEDKGLSPKIQEHCDELVSVTRPRTGLDSLNVSVAAGIIINRFLS